ncbi:galactose metabolism- protein [Knufia peltigerae]|uniref:Galactose metabolism- protein n=1 Tax=Knufia peltigerae TaxID=1002370 RepID=A0AA38YAY0_9EURO|nr:galactose metabolism- protein [Knufia peltigerae]
MGQQQSSEKSSGPRSGTPQAERDRRVNRRVSIQALSQGRSTPVDPSATKDTALAQTTTTPHLEKPALQQYLQASSSSSSSPEASARGAKLVERSGSRASRDNRHNESLLEHRPRQQRASVPVPQASGPVDVPVSRSKQDSSAEERFEDHHTSAYQDRRYTPVAQLRPPRLPLPIADVPIPESPTLAPVDKGNADVPIFETDEPLAGIESQLRRKSSMMSTTTESEEEVGEELQPYAVEPANAQTVPTVIEWNHGGQRVYVTGTFANWERKYRLHPRKNGTGMFTTISLPSGTHHLKFVVDGEMVTSPDLPTAVDFNNFLVNYIEIATEDLAKQRRESAQQGNRSSTLAPEEHEQSASGAQTPEATDMEELLAEEIPPGDYRQLVPQCLVDVDLAEDTDDYNNAVKLIQEAQQPPALPLFLNRSILNGVLPVKDDNSVLTLPNHTVLNHLMTSSVKNGVLATSVTTRYRKKYVTTISFKPVPRFKTQFQ